MSVLSKALTLEPGERESHVRLACGGDQQLYDEVTEALEWEERMGSFLKHPLIVREEGVSRFEPGELISERFEIVREIGEGGMGIVYEALDHKRNQRIAIKFAKPPFHRLLSPELEGALRVRHPNICLVNEIHTARIGHGEVDFLSMELLEGETLSDYLSAHEKLSLEDAVEVGRQLCKGLAEAHRCDVIHRDLKAANVILCRPAAGGIRAVITDFGLSGEAQTGELCGTPRYMAPELWLGQEASKASDIYALGIILHEMAAGRSPAADSTAQVRMQMKDMPHFYSRLVEECLSLDPARRCRAFAKALHESDRRKRAWSRRGLVGAERNRESTPSFA